MKLLLATLALSVAPLASFAMGCSHGYPAEEITMSCTDGTVYDEKTRSCITPTG